MNIIVLMLACGLAGCSQTISPSVASLVGSWADTPQLNRDLSVYRVLLDLRADGSYATEWRMYEPKRDADSLRAYSIAEGHFTIRHDSIFLRPAVIREWDRDFYGGTVRVSKVDSALLPPGRADNGAHFEVSAETLRLHYLSYPADAPVETETTYSRVK